MSTNLLSKLALLGKSTEKHGLSSHNLSLVGQITDFVPRDYLYLTTGAKFINIDDYKLPGHVLRTEITKRFNPDLPGAKISEEDAQFYAERSVIVPRNQWPSPTDELVNYLCNWLAVDYFDLFGHYPRQAELQYLPTDDLVKIYREIDPIFTDTYLAELMFEERERHITRGNFIKAGYLTLVVVDGKEYSTYLIKDGDKYAVTVNAAFAPYKPGYGEYHYLLASCFGEYGLVPSEKAADYFVP